jgi:hypothetical protein
MLQLVVWIDAVAEGLEKPLAVNRRMNIKTFQTPKDAFEWLEHTPNKSDETNHNFTDAFCAARNKNALAAKFELITVAASVAPGITVSPV